MLLIDKITKITKYIHEQKTEWTIRIFSNWNHTFLWHCDTFTDRSDWVGLELYNLEVHNRDTTRSLENCKWLTSFDFEPETKVHNNYNITTKNIVNKIFYMLIVVNWAGFISIRKKKHQQKQIIHLILNYISIKLKFRCWFFGAEFSVSKQ